MRKKERKLARFGAMLAAGLTAREARVYSELPERTPALQAIIHDRREKRARFERVASSRVHAGVWMRDEIETKWLRSIAKLYTQRGWRVVEGARGKQDAIPVGSPNPWAMYRSYLKQAPDPGHISPWMIKPSRKGRSYMFIDRDILKAQRIERRAGVGGKVSLYAEDVKVIAQKGGVSQTQIMNWIEQKERAIKKARGAKREQLRIEKARLERLLYGGTRPVWV